VRCTLHQLRHAHATELVNGGVPLETIRRRLGHARIETTLRYAEQRDAVADADIRAWRQGKSGRCR
jgi:site-specific recombinase XerD